MILQTIFSYSARASETTNNIALLILRAGLAFCFVLLFALKQSQASAIFSSHPAALLPLVALSIGAFLLVVVGLVTRPAAALSGLSWIVALYSGLHGSTEWSGVPYRSALFVFLFATLAITGPGKFSLDHFFRREPTAI